MECCVNNLREVMLIESFKIIKAHYKLLEQFIECFISEYCYSNCFNIIIAPFGEEINKNKNSNYNIIFRKEGIYVL